MTSILVGFALPNLDRLLPKLSGGTAPPPLPQDGETVFFYSDFNKFGIVHWNLFTATAKNCQVFDAAPSLNVVLNQSVDSGAVITKCVNRPEYVLTTDNPGMTTALRALFPEAINLEDLWKNK